MAKNDPVLTQEEKAMRECEVMLNYALATGKKVPRPMLDKLAQLRKQRDPARIDQVGEIHMALAAAIQPASPSSIFELDQNRNSSLRFLGPVPLVRKLMILTLMCLFVFVGLFFFPEVDSTSINGDILSYEPTKFALNELFIIATAALGSAFYALFEAYKYIATSSYDPKYESLYWIRFILGVVSGVILAQFIVVSVPDAASDATGISNTGGMMTFKPLLAFLGGFSARVVHKILNSLVDSVETFVSGSARDAIRTREEAAAAQLQDKISNIHQENSRREAANRIEAVMKLMKLQEKMTEGADNEYIKAQIKQLANEMITPVSGQALFDGGGAVPPNPPMGDPNSIQPNGGAAPFPGDLTGTENPPMLDTGELGGNGNPAGEYK